MNYVIELPTVFILYCIHRENAEMSLVVREEGNITFPSTLTTKLADDFGDLSVNGL